jgi:maltose O-acetyltransferase
MTLEKMIIKIFRKYYGDVFMFYSYLSTLFFVFMDISPHLLRNFIYRCLLGKMGKRVSIDYFVYMRFLKNIEIGDDVIINRGCQFYTSGFLGKKIAIGNNVAISPNVKFYGAAHDYRRKNMPDIADNIIIEDDCWICADVIILQGVNIARGSVIGAGSVVTKNIPAYSVAVGNPARVISTRVVE